ncbi:hypothetical protein [Leptospirillum ferriphilum]|uniref:Uncharacterized protein n=1 Tax=Leptospirillum ferriphilum YSK TaxID=1441628 RepID=A0A059Y0Y5_9BACT|nr:hypothetical protein [Leptospirillum ferriphilum]AIA31196.1 hypothetical protein Y981_12030 [Leptospirillum ferriphilum YSK]
MSEDTHPMDNDDDDIPLAPHRKEGRGCFLVLIILSAIPVVFFLITFTGGDTLTYIYMRNWVTDHALMNRMPVTWSPEKKAEARKVLDQFYDAGRARKVPSTEVIALSSEFREMMSYPGDVHEESLVALLRHAWGDLEKYHSAPPGPPPSVLELKAGSSGPSENVP